MCANWSSIFKDCSPWVGENQDIQQTLFSPCCGIVKCFRVPVPKPLPSPSYWRFSVCLCLSPPWRLASPLSAHPLCGHCVWLCPQPPDCSMLCSLWGCLTTLYIQPPPLRPPVCHLSWTRIQIIFNSLPDAFTSSPASAWIARQRHQEVHLILY